MKTTHTSDPSRRNCRNKTTGSYSYFTRKRTLSVSTGEPSSAYQIRARARAVPEVGGVRLGLSGDEDVRHAFENIVAAAGPARSDATIEGDRIKKMVSRPNALELILGMKRYPTFGAAILAGVEGTPAELFVTTPSASRAGRDRSHTRGFLLPPGGLRYLIERT